MTVYQQQIINRLLLSPVDSELSIADIRLSYRLNEASVNQAPKARIKGKKRGKEFHLMTFNAKKSTDRDGDKLHYQWKVKSGKALLFKANSKKVLMFPLSPGKLVLQLQVNDGTANSAITEKTIWIAKGQRKH